MKQIKLLHPSNNINLYLFFSLSFFNQYSDDIQDKHPSNVVNPNLTDHSKQNSWNQPAKVASTCGKDLGNYNCPE